MSVNTLGGYLFKHALKTIVATFVLFLSVAIIADFVGIARRVRDGLDIDVQAAAAIAVMRALHVSEQIFPFAVLFGAMASLLSLSKRHELVVARAFGISVWQFLAPVLGLAILIGVFAVAVYNPISTVLFETSMAHEEALFASRQKPAPNTQRDAWIYARGENGATIIRAGRIHRTQPVLYRIVAYSYDIEGRFVRLIRAPRAFHEAGRLVFQDGSSLMPGINAAPRAFTTLTINTTLSFDDINKQLLDARTLSIWDMPAAIAQGDRLGVSVSGLRMAYQTLLARPLLLVSMIFIAASVSLRFFRLGGIRRFLILGASAGFTLYIVTQLASDLGEAGLLNAILAAWLPPIAALFLGTTTLLYQEDG